MSVFDFTKKKIKENERFDREFISKIQPQGGISFKDERVIKTGDGYEACLYIYEYPTSVDRHWLTSVMNIKNVVATVDISIDDTKTALKNINRAMGEQTSRYGSAKDMKERIDAQARFDELKNLYVNVAEMDELIKPIVIRLYVTGQTQGELDKNVAGIRNYLESHGYKSMINLNETYNEWTAQFKPKKSQNMGEYGRYGQPMLSSAIAVGYPFHFTNLDDPRGTKYGTTTANGGEGNVFLDLFHNDQIRTSYNGVVFGGMGSGKSTLLKKITLDEASRGNFVRGFDATGEFTDLVHFLGGKIVSLDGTDGAINPMEIMRSDEDENGSFIVHLSKLNTIYKFLSPKGSDPLEAVVFEQLCRETYIKFNILPADENLEKTQITGLPPTAYPLFSDVIVVCNEKIQELLEKGDVDTMELKRYKNIMLILKNVCENYGNIFNRHTSIENISNTQVVFFNIKSLISMKSEIFDAQLFQGISLCWDNCVSVGGPMKHKWENGEIDWDDITRTIIIIDESHRSINTSKPHALDQVLRCQRELRKFFSGIILASQSLRDYVPEGSSDENIDKLKIIFELSIYKFLLRQDSNSKKMIENTFAGQLTQSEIEKIPKLQRGQCILSIAGYKNIEFNIEVTDEELSLFKGGA